MGPGISPVSIILGWRALLLTRLYAISPHLDQTKSSILPAQRKDNGGANAHETAPSPPPFTEEMWQKSTGPAEREIAICTLSATGRLEHGLVTAVTKVSQIHCALYSLQFSFALFICLHVVQ